MEKKKYYQMIGAKQLGLRKVTNILQQLSKNQSPNQAGLRSGRFAAAFYSIDRAALWRMMERDDAPEKIILLIKAFFEYT